MNLSVEVIDAVRERRCGVSLVSRYAAQDRQHAELASHTGAELPRCHLAVAQGRIEDYQWQRWVWRGLLPFAADPSECMNALKAKLK